MRIYKKLIIGLIFFFIFQCNYVDKEIYKSQKKENLILQKYLGKKSSVLKTKFGEPTKIIFKAPYKIYIYQKSQLLITCERKFFINPKRDLIEKFNSQNCINK
tara:strand:- start:202 stop:510 length:309 start_codon:yes stop_codon:yes gene_type:complete